MRKAALATVALGACVMAVGASALAQTRAPTVGLAGTTTPRRAPARTVQTPYYVLHTDLTDEEGRETDLRMTRMFEEYLRVCAGFAGKVDKKFDFYLFRTEADYRAYGGPPKSAGVFISGPDGKRLMAWVGPTRANNDTWDTIQHEGFHQFIDASMKAELPIWVNEGLAEYFGQGIWTGDGFVTGLIPSARLAAVRRGIQGNFKPFRQIMAMNSQTWNDDLNPNNYEEAWAMIHFLAHADGGRFVAPFGAFMNQVSRGTEGQRAWENVFGRDIDGFQRQFAQWWMSLPDRPTEIQFTQAMVATHTSFLARATLHRQQYPDANAFFRNFNPNNLTPTRDLWLPPAMWAEYHDFIVDSGGWTLENGANPKLTLTLADGTKFVGQYALANGKVARVGVQVTPGQNTNNARGQPPR